MNDEQTQLNNRLFNIDILILDNSNSKYLSEVKKLNIFENTNTNFEPEGLFSTEIFGPIGSKTRNITFGYINLKIDVLHPLVYEQIITLKSFYKDIINGNKYAKFDNKEKDFVLSDQTEGETGYAFFLKHLNDIKLVDNDSDQRKFKIEFIKKYGNGNYYINKWLVLPAGLRDYTIDKSGKPTEDEVNDLYRKLLTTTNSLVNMRVNDDNIGYLDPVRLRIQNILVLLYEHFKTLMDGKSKFIQGKWGKRAITYGTRNVITPLITDSVSNDDENGISMNHSVCGIYQFAKAIAPIAMNRINTVFISKLLTPDTITTKLVNPKTMKSELKDIKVNKRDEWLTIEGLDNILNKLGQEDVRNSPIKIDDYYMFLMYDDGKNIELFLDTNSIPNEYDVRYIRPITYTELVYISIYDIKDKYPGFLTRYPVANLGGIYPTKIYLKTTIVGRTVNFKMPGYETIMREYPILSEEFVSSLSPHNTHIGRLTADFDGDFSI